VSARADLVVEGAVYFIGFGTEDACEVVRHGKGTVDVVEEAEMEELEEVKVKESFAHGAK
jgi:hypothetical protein